MAEQLIGSLDASNNLKAASASNPIPVTLVSGAASDPSEGSPGAAVPSKAQLQGVQDGSGNLQPLKLGPQITTAAVPVALATDDVMAGSRTETAPATDTASSGLNGRLQRIAQRITSLIALLPTALGSAAAASSLAVTASTEDVARQGIVTETAPASDTASSGLNGRLQRIAQRVTSLIALFPTALGSQTSAASFSVVHASDDALIGIKTETAPASDTASSGLNGRLQRIAQNITTMIAATLLVKGATASGSSIANAPVTTGGRAATANPTAVTDGQVVNAMMDKLGKAVCIGALRDLKGMQQTSLSNTTGETTIVTAVASTFLDLYGLILANTGSTTTKVSIRDDTAGTVRAIIEVPTLETRGFMLPVDSALPQTAQNKNWTAQCASATTALEVTALFVKNI